MERDTVFVDSGLAMYNVVMGSKPRHDSLVSSVSTSETDILGDMIPYRCPKCGNQRRFAALRDLKLHLDEEHSFKMGCVKPRSRNKVFNHKMATEKPRVTTGKYIKTKHGGKFSPRSSDSDESYGSMLKYYDDEAKILEMKVKMAKETEIKNKLNRNILPKSRKDNPPGISLPREDILKENFSNVNNQLLRSRHKEWHTSEALYQAEDVIQGVEEAAENRCVDQQVVIRDLVNDLRQKEGQLNRANNDLDKVRREREALMVEVEELFSEANTGNTVLREELGRREHMLGDVNRQLGTLRARARVDLDRKEDELVAAEGRVEALEKEREHLVQGTSTLLEQADKDRDVLQHTVQTKERQLRQVNKELDKLKIEQSNLVQESIDLYEKANEGTAKLTHLVQTKDNQLHEACHELESMKKVHEKLIWQSKTLTEQADSNNQTLTEMLQSKEEELERAKQKLSKVKENNTAAFKVVLADKEAELGQARGELAKVKAEKVTMLESVKDLTQKASNQGNKMMELQNLVQEKERRLHEKERDLDSLKTFLSSAAEKEVVARSKLEQFISGLIDRADKAESELHKIKTRSVSEVDLSRSHTLGDVSDVTESDREGQWSPRQDRKVRARSQDSSLKSADYNKVSMNPSPKDPHSLGATQERSTPNEVNTHASKPHCDKHVKPWQQILRKNCVSDTHSTDNSDLEILETEPKFDRSVVSDKHQSLHSSQVDRPIPKKRHLKKTASLDKALLSHDQNTEIDQSKQLSHTTGPMGLGTKGRDHHDNKIGNYVTVDRAGHPDESVPNISETMTTERDLGVFHFGQTNNENGECPDPMGSSRHRHSVLSSAKPTKTDTRNIKQFTPQTSDFSKTVPFSEYSMSPDINSQSQGIGRRSTLVTNVPDLPTLAMVHPPPQQGVPGRVFARRHVVPRYKSESDLKHTTNSERSHQLNQELRDSYLTVHPDVLNRQEYHHGYPHQSIPRMVPEVRNVSVPQNRHIDIPSYNTDVSSSLRYPIGPFPQVKGQAYIETDVSSSQRFPLAPFSREESEQLSSVSSSQRLTLNNPANLENLSNIPSRGKDQLTRSNNSQGGQGPPSDVQTKRGHSVRPNIIHGTQGHFATPNGFQIGQGHFERPDGVQLGHGHSVRTDGVHLVRSNGVQQVVQGSEGQIRRQPNDHINHVMYIPVDARTGQPVHLPGVQQNSSLNGTPGIHQTPGIPVHYGSGATGIASHGVQAMGGSMTVNPQSTHASLVIRGVAPPTRSLDQSQKLTTTQQPPVNNPGTGRHSPVLTAEYKPATPITSQTVPSVKQGVSQSSSSSFSSVVDGNGDHDNSLLDVMSLVDYEHDVDEPDDVESATFEQFMDENGILWELSDTCRSQSAPDSFDPGKPRRTLGGHPSTTMTSKPTTGQLDQDPHGARKPEAVRTTFQRSDLSGRPVSSQNDQSKRSKSAETIPHERLPPSIRNRSLSPRVRFSDQQQYWPCSEDDTNQMSSSPMSRGLQSGGDNISLCSQSQADPISSSLTEGKPNFEELWLRDVAIGTDTSSIESYVPLQTRSIRPALKQNKIIKPFPSDNKTTVGDSPSHGRQKDQGCQPVKDSSTQTWLLDCPLSLDDLSSVSQRSSFVRTRRPRSISPGSVSCSPARTHKTSLTNTLTQMSSCQSTGPISENQGISADSEFKDHSTTYDVQSHGPQVQGHSIGSSQNSEQKEILPESYLPSHLSTETNGRLYNRKGSNSPILDSSHPVEDGNYFSLNTRYKGGDLMTDQSGDSKYSEEGKDLPAEIKYEERNRHYQSPDSRYRQGRDDRSSNLLNRTDDRSDQFADSRDRIDQSPDSRYRREGRTNQSQDSRYRREDIIDQSQDARYRNDQYPHRDSKYGREGRNDQSKDLRYTRDRHDQSPNSNYRNDRSPNPNYRNNRSPNSKYRNDESPHRYSRYKRGGRIYDDSPNSRYKNVDRIDYSDEYEDSQDDWTDDKNCRSRRKHFHKRERKHSNTYAEYDDSDVTERARKKERSNYKKSSSRKHRSSHSESDSPGSEHVKRSERNRSFEIPSTITGASQSPHQKGLSVTIENKCSDNLNMEVTADAATDHVQQSKPLSISSHDEGAKSNSTESKDRDIGTFHISEQGHPRVGTEMSEPNAESGGNYPVCDKGHISDKTVYNGVRHESEYERTDMSLVEESEGLQNLLDEDTEVEPMAVGKEGRVVMDTDDQYSLYSIGSSTLSRTSSQESLLDSLPKSRREAVRQRRLSLYLVFRNLDTKTRGRVAGVCREWRKVSRQSALWKRVHLSHTRCTSRTLETLARWCTQLETLHLEDVYTRKQLELETDEDYAQAVRASLEAGVECLLQVSESTLKSFTVINCPHVLTDKCMWLASCYSRMLQNVCYHSNTHILGADVLWALGAGCGLIRSLDIAPLYPCVNTDKFTNKCLQIISQFLPELDRLCVGGEQLDVNGFVLIAKSCQRLYSLSLHGCVDIVEDVAMAMCRKGLKNLRSLDFHHTPITDKALLHFYSSCKHLKSIHVSFCLEDASTDPDLKKNTENFNKRIKALEKLKKNGGLWNILQLEAQRVKD